MYRKFEIKDEAGEKIVFRVYPNLAKPHNNLIEYDKLEIKIVLSTHEAMLAMIDVVGKFMGGNTINHLEVTEVEEV